MEKKNFCALPFHHVNIHTNGNYNVCCSHRNTGLMNINKDTVNDWWQSDYLEQVRKDFLEDRKHPGCSWCWQRESEGFPSLRTRTQREYQLLKVDTDSKSIKNIEVAVGNLCNLKCLMCNERDSSSFLAENKRLGINVLEQKELDWSDDAYRNLKELLDQKPAVINFRGGEPLYIKKLFEIIKSIPQDQAESTILHITTNATQWSDAWRDVLSRFRMVRFMFSLDGTNNVYEYIRFPASWAQVVKNIEQMMSMPNATCLVHSVVQNINVAYLGDLVEWCQQRSLYLNLELLTNPKYLEITNLPDLHRSHALKNLKKLCDQNLEPHTLRVIDNCIRLLEQSKFDAVSWNIFVEQITMRDRLRGNDYKHFILL